MARDLHAQTATAVELPTLYPAWIVRLDILGDPVLVWTGLGSYAPTLEATGDPQLAGLAYDGIANLGEISAVVDGSRGSETVKLSLPGVDPDLDALKPIITDGRLWQFRQAWIWLLLLNEYGEIQGRPIRIKTGRMDTLAVAEDAESGSATVSVDIESHQAYAGQSRNTRWSEQTELDALDQSQNFTADLANRSPVIGQSTSGVSGTGGTGGGAGGGGGSTGGGGGGYGRGGGGCPAVGTPVQLSGGDQRAIEELRAGDQVETWHHETMQWGAYEVLSVEVLEGVESFRMESHDGRVLEASWDHPVHTQDGWKVIAQVEPTDTVTGLPDGAIRSVYPIGPRSVVRMGVKDAHSFVSAGFLSHNKMARDVQLY